MSETEEEHVEIQAYRKGFDKMVPKYDGNPFEFVNFIESFDFWIHNTDAPEWIKLKTLVDCLDDEFSLKNSLRKYYSFCYDMALKKFKNHFYFQICSFLYLEDIDAVEDPNNLEDLLTTWREFQLFWKSVKYFSLETSLNHRLIKITAEKFPFEYVEEFMQKNDIQKITMARFLDYIHSIIQKKENLRTKLECFGLDHLKNRTYDEISTVSPDMQHTNYLQQYQNRKFFLSHLSTEQRIRKIMKRNLCKNCLKRNHKASNCRMRNNCKHCPKKHHTLLCEETKSITKCSDIDLPSSDSE